MGQQQVMQSVELAKELAALDPMLGVHQRLLYVQSGDIVNVLHTSLEILNVALDLIIMEGEEPLLELALKLVLRLVLERLEVLKQKLVEEHLEKLKKQELRHQIKFVEQDKEPAVLDLMMAVLQKLLYALSGDIVSVLHTNQEILSVALGLTIVP